MTTVTHGGFLNVRIVAALPCRIAHPAALRFPACRCRRREVPAGSCRIVAVFRPRVFRGFLVFIFVLVFVL
ncbi:hypothetical protein, partial [Pandoraea sp. E26]|uniref:hypothetical protein n=1 Tax=Pandoraea sp. E26 TaxID=1427365 RepID=UPI001F34F9B8